MSRKRSGNHVPRVFLDQPLAEGAQLELDGERFHHLRNVLRIQRDDPVIVFDGGGGELDARVTWLDRRALRIECGPRREPDREPRLRVTLAQAIVRGDRMDYAIAKAVELGVAAIQPLRSQRDKVRLDGPRGQKKQAHWQQVAIAAAEQSGRTRVPIVAEPCALDTWLQAPPAGQPILLDPGAGQPLRQLAAPEGHDVVLLVGPESGFSADETARARAAGFMAVALGPRVLRTETAGAACLAAIQTLWGDLGGDPGKSRCRPE